MKSFQRIYSHLINLYSHDFNIIYTLIHYTATIHHKNPNANLVELLNLNHLDVSNQDIISCFKVLISNTPETRNYIQNFAFQYYHRKPLLTPSINIWEQLVRYPLKDSILKNDTINKDKRFDSFINSLYNIPILINLVAEYTLQQKTICKDAIQFTSIPLCKQLEGIPESDINIFMQNILNAKRA